MTQKVSNERVAELLGIGTLLYHKRTSYGGLTEIPYSDEDVAYIQSEKTIYRLDAINFHTDPFWTGPLLVAYANRLFSGGCTWLGVLSSLKRDIRNEYIENKPRDIETLNTALITALDALDKDVK